jgi:hypothetical protein
MGPIGCPETSIKDYHTTPRNIPEERRSHQYRGGSLKSQTEKSDRFWHVQQSIYKGGHSSTPDPTNDLVYCHIR